MAFITQANASSIRRKIDLVKAGNIPIDDIYLSELTILSENERRWLSAARMLYEDLEMFIEYVYSEKKRVDTWTLVYEGNPPAYHLDWSCEKLRADYRNFFIPPEVKVRGEKEIITFRTWFSKNECLLEKNSQLFLTRMELEFKLKNPPLLKTLEASNSGSEDIENIDLHRIQSNIDHLIEKGEEFRNSNKETGIIHQYGNKSFKKTGDEH